MEMLSTLLNSTAFLTVVSGTLVFVFGQIFVEFVLKPIRRYKELRGKAASLLVFLLRVTEEKQ